MHKLLCDKNLGYVVRRLREERGIKQYDVITYLQLHGLRITKSTYSKTETCTQHTKISKPCFPKQCFQVSYDMFFEELDND